MSFKQIKTSSAFTIVELLIVVVVIAILAAITIVAYNGITSQAEDSSLKSALKTAANKVEIEKVRTESYPANEAALASLGLELANDGYTLEYSGGSSYCMSVSSNKNVNKAFYISSQEGEIKEGDCSALTEIAANTSIQNISQAQCQALPTYTGSNEDALRTVTDARGGTVRSYRIAKLADDNCWMLDNLKLGSTTSSITLTPSDSNVASNFTLPQLIISGTRSNDIPQAMGPVPGDIGTVSTNYGYLYNWSAATAGETTVSMPIAGGNAEYSICPANWRLPLGYAVPATDEFAMLNAKMNNPGSTEPSLSSGAGFRENWLHDGPFKGLLAGTWGNSGFSNQGSQGYFWTSSAYAYNGTAAHMMLISSSFASSGYSTSRDSGRSVRCLLN